MSCFLSISQVYFFRRYYRNRRYWIMKSSTVSRCIHIVTFCALFLCMICIIFFINSAPMISNGDRWSPNVIFFLLNAIFWLVLTIFIIGTISSVILFLCNLMHFRKLSKKVFWINAALDIYPLLLLFIVSGGNASNVAHLLACPITAFPFFS